MAGRRLSGYRAPHAMALRLKRLMHLDPLAVPLPHGTEVTTRVARLREGVQVPQGSVGRVAGARGEMLDVMIVGVGLLSYLREELTPSKAGQVRYAARRAAAWNTLGPCIVLEAVVGSRAWGLADEGSDTDARGAFGLPLPWTLGLAAPPEDLVSADGSATYWEIAKTVRQALRSDPNTLELLFVPGARALDPIGAWLLEARDAFVSREIYGSFGRYALSQLKRLAQAQRLAEHRAVVLAWLKEEPPPSLDTIARRLASSQQGLGREDADAELQAKEYVKQLYRSLFDQGLLAARDFVSLVRFAREDAGARFDLPRELRPKNAYNLIRLILTAIRWLKTGEPQLEMVGHDRERLFAIKRGQVPLGGVIAAAEALTPELDAARAASPLPHRPDAARADALLQRIGQEIARRFVERHPGPFGRDAPAPPEVAWEHEQLEGRST